MCNLIEIVKLHAHKIMAVYFYISRSVRKCVESCIHGHSKLLYGSMGKLYVIAVIRSSSTPKMITWHVLRSDCSFITQVRRQVMHSKYIPDTLWLALWLSEWSLVGVANRLWLEGRWMGKHRNVLLYRVYYTWCLYMYM